MSGNPLDLSVLVRDPQAARRFGARLADALRSTQPTLVVVDAHPSSVILGHVAAEELSARLAIISEDSGLFYVTDAPRADDRVAEVSAEFPDYPSVRAVSDFLAKDGAEIVAISSLSPFPGETSDLPVAPTLVTI